VDSNRANVLPGNMNLLRMDLTDTGPGLRWFIRVGGDVQQNVGFRSKQRANSWIESHGRAVDWRAGYSFRLRDSTLDIEVVDAKGNLAKP
jgi:hypothetical protein